MTDLRNVSSYARTSSKRKPHAKGAHRPASPPSREKTVAVYGGTRIPEDSPLFKLYYELGQRLGKAGYAVVTGGGPGGMEAANNGAKSKNAFTYAMKMHFIGEESDQKNDVSQVFQTFSKRLDGGFEKYAGKTIAGPGGIGTLHEVMKKADELVNNKTLYPSQKQILLVDYKGYWKNFLNYLKEGPIAMGLMNKRILDIFKIVKPKEVVSELEKKVPWTTGLKQQTPKAASKARI